MRAATIEHEIAALAATGGDGVLIIEAAADEVVQVLGVYVHNLDNTTDELMHYAAGKITTKGALASAAAPNLILHETGDGATGLTLYGADNNGMTTEPTTWAAPLHEDAPSSRVGFRKEWSPINSIWLSPGELFGIRLITTPVTAFKAACKIEVVEYGG